MSTDRTPIWCATSMKVSKPRSSPIMMHRPDRGSEHLAADLVRSGVDEMLHRGVGQRPARCWMRRQRRHRVGESILHRDRAIAGQRRPVLHGLLVAVPLLPRQVDEHREARGPVDQRADR